MRQADEFDFRRLPDHVASQRQRQGLRMTGRIAMRDGTMVHVREDGARDGPPLLLLHALGTDHRVWDRIVPLLSPTLRIIRPDMRGHGASDVPPAPYRMGTLVSDAEDLCDALGVKDAIVVGLSIGGLIAQGLAVKRLDLMRGLVLSNTAARIGTVALWEERIAAVRRDGMAGIADATMARWVGRDMAGTAWEAHCRARLLSTPSEGWIGCASAIAGTDFYATTATLRLPVLGIAGGQDGSTPADLVRETVDLVSGSRFALIRRAGHLPCVEDPISYAEALGGFLEENAHV
jgi:3-oxoadipate enol-lactonase